MPTLAPAPDLVECLRFALREKDQPREPWREDRLHASDLGVGIGEGCERALWLRLRGTERRKPHDGERWMWHHGHRLQREIYDLIRPVVEREHPPWTVGLWEYDLSPYVRVDGARMDFALLNLREQIAIPVDCKTRRGGAFAYLDAKPHESQAIQVQLYAAGLSKMLGPRWRVPYEVVLSVDREGSNFMRSWIVERNDTRAHLAAKRLREISEKEEAPPILEPKVRFEERKTTGRAVFVSEPWPCAWCDYRGGVCPGAIPEEEWRSDKGLLVGKLQLPDETKLDPHDDPDRAALAEWAAPLIARHLADEDEEAPAVARKVAVQ